MWTPLRRVELLRELRVKARSTSSSASTCYEGLDLPEVSLVAISARIRKASCVPTSFAHPDHRPCGAKRVRHRRHVRRRHHRSHAQRPSTRPTAAVTSRSPTIRNMASIRSRSSRRSPMSTTCSPRRTSTPRHCSVPDTETRTKPAIRISACHIPARGGIRQAARGDSQGRIARTGSS